MLNKKIAAIVAASGMAVAGLALGITPAKAFDPVSNSFAIVGSDTLEDVVGALVNGTNVTGSGVRVTTADSSTVASFDATGSGTIITKPYGNRFQRPNGSGDGRTALERAIDGGAFSATPNSFTTALDTNWANQVISGQVDISRGSSAGSTSGNSTDVLAQYTFGRDAIAYAYGSNVTPLANGYIPVADMTLLYQCDQPTMDAYHVSNVVIPQPGSGTRKDFLKKINISSDSSIPDASLVANGGCIKTGQEHDASGLLAGELMPMSASRWIAMKNGYSYDKSVSSHTTVTLGSLVSGTPSVNTVSGQLVPNVAYYKNSTWGRDTYLFVDKTRVTKDVLTVGAAAATGATTVTLADASAVYAGEKVSGTGIASATTVSSVSGNVVTLSKAITAALTTSSIITFAGPSYNANLAALFDYTNETSLTYQGPSTGANAATFFINMNDTTNYPSFGAYTAAAVKLKFGFLPASVENLVYSH